MSNAKPKSIEHKRIAYALQTRGSSNHTTAQWRQLRKTQARLDHQQQRSVHRETKRNRRQQFRDWMAGMRG